MISKHLYKALKSRKRAISSVLYPALGVNHAPEIEYVVSSVFYCRFDCRLLLNARSVLALCGML